MIRHLALCVAALTAFLLRRELHTGNQVLWIVGFTALLNLATTVLSERVRFRPTALLLSPVLGIAGWAALVYLTGGPASPFVAGFGLEILLSALAFPPMGTALVTGGTLAGLWGQQVILGLENLPLGILALQTGFLLAMGGLTGFLSGQSSRARERHSRRTLELQGRLKALEGELEDARTMGTVGENVARLAHGLKNTVHTLRGFAGILDPQLSGEGRGRQALEGLRASIDRLEEVVRDTLHPAPSPGDGKRQTRGDEVRRTLDRVCEEVGRLHPDIRWMRRAGSAFPAVAAPPGALREVLLVLVQNAAEASGGRGEVLLTTRTENGRFQIEVKDHGPGIPAATREAIFRPGHTTKPNGNGFGLFLARRLLESLHGTLRVRQGGGGGCLFSAAFPLPKGGGIDA